MSSGTAVVVGTRPEAVKLAYVARALGDRAVVVHTGQHYDATLWADVVGDLPMPPIAHHIAVGGRSRGEQIGRATELLTRLLIEHPVRAVVVQGDTNSTLAGALAANATGTPLVHVEAGLRSDDRSMPEESNRLLVDRISDLCCVPIAANAARLEREGVAADRIEVTGNTLADALSDLVPRTGEADTLLGGLGLERGGFALATVHRASNVDDRRTLAALADGLAALARRVTVVLPLHPHTRARLAEFDLTDRLAGVRTVDPVGPRQFLALEAAAGLLVSDSGGVQEEACLLRRPLVVLRNSTERPELLDGWCRLLGDADPVGVLEQAWADVPSWTADLAVRPLPYGTDSASARIVAEIDRRWPVPR
ncbi:UDP-N-acetylglucosamine 2-epimerase (non-hydrolysing) [Klenkia soli]|uniref:UDP-N-acetylglucosamine 2-epimerase (Non-hydrolysing) n=1 Tax=Klenkia soli TaxID=1052260 RepID=A0A1H0J2B7_9ACTN|nr:UDP-N-acetylglucosamine 2-epimerase (non-hydrolyzing) [Klenkia soli]SDO37856.1 UDP-N-acetylglucosamine 2-epimerase (non-hydrolysing) [Klenkia soli]